jgi:hypothetical protein
VVGDHEFIFSTDNVSPSKYTSTAATCIENVRTALLRDELTDPVGSQAFSHLNQNAERGSIDSGVKGSNIGIGFHLSHMMLPRMKRNWQLW